MSSLTKMPPLVWGRSSGDTDTITVGARTNIQDNAVIHADPGAPCNIGNDCVIGHTAIVHGATLSHHVLIGMHATVLNHAQIGEYSIIGANAMVPQGMIIPPYSLVLGTPQKWLKPSVRKWKPKSKTM